MSATPKPQKAQALVLVSRLPNLPRVPKSVVDRFPEMTQYQANLDAVWEQIRQTYTRDLGEIVAALNAKT